MKFTLVVLATLLLGANVQAQVRKCVGADGRVTYSDGVCSGTSSSETIKNLTANTLDSSGFRQQVKKSRAEQESDESRSSESSRQSLPQDCKFSYFTIGDDKGKRLAENAKAECLQNNEAKLTGGQISLEHYNFWKDHFAQKSSSRQAAISRADANSREFLRPKQNTGIEVPKTRYTCRPNILGDALDCK